MTDKQKAPGLVATSAEGQNIAKRSGKHSTIGPRLHRLLDALINRKEITRKQADRIAHASNGPHYIGVLRKRHKVPVLMSLKSGTDYDGEPSSYGIYSLDDEGKQIARELLQRSAC
jgi:hypothetical protein